MIERSTLADIISYHMGFSTFCHHLSIPNHNNVDMIYALSSIRFQEERQYVNKE